MTVFIALAFGLTLLAGLAVVWPLLRDATDRAAIAAVAAALLLPPFVVFAYLAASNHDWSRPPTTAEVPATAQATADGAPLGEAVVALESRLAANPSDEAGWVLLGSAYTALGRPDDAIRAYGEAERLAGGSNLDARLGVAEAQLLKDRSAINGEAGATIEAVLAAAPDNPKALWYGGLVALSRGDTAAADQRWTALLAKSPPERIRQIVETELMAIRGSSMALPDNPAAGPGIEVRVVVDSSLRGDIRPDAPLFVFVRDAAGGPPLAVVRRAAADLPLVVAISDADVMIPGRSLAALRKASVVARIANGGDPVARPGDAYGEAEWAPGGDGAVAVVIDRVVTKE